MEEKIDIAEKILLSLKEIEKCITDIDKRFEQVVFACGPSGYVGCSNECRGVGRRRRSGFMEDIATYLNNLGKKKDRLIISIRPVVLAFEKLKGTRSGHIIYHRIGRGMGVQEYGNKFGFSRRHVRRLYIKAMLDMYNALIENGGEELIKKYS